MIKWYWYALRPKNKSKHYFGRINEKLNYDALKKKNWENQLRLSFKSSKNYNSKKNFFKEYFLDEHNAYFNYLKKKIE